LNDARDLLHGSLSSTEHFRSEPPVDPLSARALLSGSIPLQNISDPQEQPPVDPLFARALLPGSHYSKTFQIRKSNLLLTPSPLEPCSPDPVPLQGISKNFKYDDDLYIK
jgi:hypothetical protein